MTNMKHQTFSSFWGAVLSLVWIVVTVDRKATAASVEKDGKFVLRGPKYSLDLFPIIDELKIERVFTKRNYMRFLLKCVFFQGPCDLVGKWLKPRTLAALHGTCLGCTEYQQENMERWLLLLIHHNEELFRAAMIKVCLDMKIDVPEDEKKRVIPYLNRNDLMEYILNKS